MAAISSHGGGMVVLVGGGPGGRATLTHEAAKWLSRAEVVLYDRLVAREVLGLCRPDAETIFVGGSPTAAGNRQEQINKILVKKAREGRLVVRLKGGDPFIFGRGGEEAEALAAAGVAFRVVPGVTAGVAAGALAGIPLTHRKIASTVTFVTGHEDPTKGESAIDFSALAKLETLVFYMGVANLPAIAERLITAGRAGATPAAAVENAATARQRTVVATLETIADEARVAGIAPPAVVIVGDVVRLRESLAWLEKLPLFGRTIIVTRPREQADELADRLEELGAHALKAPAIEVRPPQDYSAIDAALGQVSEFDWLVLTSPNGVGFLFARLTALGLDARALAGVKVAAVGPATAAALRRNGIAADLVPDEFTTEKLGEALCALRPEDRKRVLLARADIAEAKLAEALIAAGSQVTELTLYRTARPEALPDEAVEAIRNAKVDWITFTSSSTVQNFLAIIGAEKLSIEGIKLAAIGPVTAAALKERDLTPTVTAKPHTTDGIIEAILSAERPPR